MSSQSAFLHTDADLLPVLEELRLREPIFHRSEFGLTRADFEKSTAPAYWETSASGRRYSREFIHSGRRRILSRQGTIVSAEEDDAFPREWLEVPPWLPKK